MSATVAARSGSRFLTAATRTPALLIGAGMLALIVLAATLAPVLATHDPAAQDLAGGLLPPSPEHWLGTDQLGRDVYSRMLFAARTDLAIAGVAVVVPFVVGTTLGLLAGVLGGWVEWIVMRLTDVVVAFPFTVIAIAIAFAVGSGATGIVVAVAWIGWVVFARVVRGSARGLRDAGWLAAARGLGYSRARILFGHVLPNVMPQVIVVLMTELVVIMVAVVTFGYLGIGVPPPTPDWGTMIAEGQAFVTSKWWVPVIPGLAVVTTGVALSLVGDGLSDVWRVK